MGQASGAVGVFSGVGGVTLLLAPRPSGLGGFGLAAPSPAELPPRRAAELRGGGGGGWGLGAGAGMLRLCPLCPCPGTAGGGSPDF